MPRRIQAKLRQTLAKERQEMSEAVSDGDQVVITGANRGIGLELARQLSTRGERVVALCRSASDALRALPVDCIEGIDIRDLSGLPERLAGRRFKLLINNAGILRPNGLGEIDYSEVLEQFIVNAIGPLRLTELLLPQLVEGAKVAHITSRMGSIADNSSGGSYGYRMSKAALNAAGVSLAHDLRPRKISVFLLHPGFVRTEMTGGRGLINVDQAAEGLLERIDTLGLEESGSFWHGQGEPLPW